MWYRCDKCDTEWQSGASPSDCPKCEAERLRPLASALLENKGRLEQMEEDFRPGLPERRLADDLLDAIQKYETAKAAKAMPGV